MIILNLLEQLNKKELKELIVKCWMTHDGSWFYNSVKSFGIDAANKLNKGAIRNLAPLEVRRIKKALGMDYSKITTFEQLKKFIDDAFSILKGDFMKFTYSYPKRNYIYWEMDRCFAFEGMKLIGVKENYECGVLFRVCCWLEALGIQYEIDPQFTKCLLYSQEKCSGHIKVHLNNIE